MVTRKKMLVIALILTFIGYGVALHDFAHQVWELKGTVISLEGGYVGFIMLLIGLALLLNLTITKEKTLILQKKIT